MKDTLIFPSLTPRVNCFGCEPKRSPRITVCSGSGHRNARRFGKISAFNRQPSNYSRACLPNGKFDGGWLTFQLKNEEVIAAALEKEFAPFMTEEKLGTRRISEKAKTINTIITVAGFAIGILGIAIAIYLFVHRQPFLR
jgi:hypothetical protein